jgi:hypothetical protein
VFGEVKEDILLANKLSNSLTNLMRSVNIETKSRHEYKTGNELRRPAGAEPPSITFAFQACPRGESELHNRF